MSSKGGVGKTAFTIHIGTELAHRKNKVFVLDGDYNQDSSIFVKKANIANLHVIEGINEDNLLDNVDYAEEQGADYIIIDTPGGHSRLSMLAIGRSDIICIPSRKTSPDFRNALKTIKDIKQLEKSNSRHVNIKYNYSIIWNDVSTQFDTKTIKEILDIVQERQIPVFSTSMMHRSALDDCQSRNVSIYEMKDFYPNRKKFQDCIKNVVAVTNELLRKV
jgi:chromosome partitioning protein